MENQTKDPAAKTLWEWDGEEPWKAFARDARALTEKLYADINRHRPPETRISDPKIPGLRDFEEIFEVPLKRLLIETQLKLVKMIMGEQAQHRGRLLFLLEKTCEFYKALEDLDWKEAERKHPENDRP